jgi:hypothetical protein
MRSDTRALFGVVGASFLVVVALAAVLVTDGFGALAPDDTRAVVLVGFAAAVVVLALIFYRPLTGRNL